MLAVGCARNSQEINKPVLTTGIGRTQRTPRKIYRYSVIPGGVYSSDELARARRLDSIIAAHYADFGGSVRVQPSLSPGLFYISYRKGDRVYWTTKKHRIAKGEALLTDGKHLARTRCGNRLSLSAQLPTLTINEPNENQLAGIQPPENPLADMPLAPLISPGLDVPEFPGSDGPAVAPFPLARSGAGDVASPTPTLLSPLFAPSYIPFGFGGFPIGGILGTTTPIGTTGGGSTTGTGGGTTITGGGGITATVPEPGSLMLLLATGALALLFCLLRRVGASQELS